jgi:hypothetical protein
MTYGSRILTIVSVASALAGCAQHTDSGPPSPPVEIPFVHQGGIYDWKADGTGAILIESLQHRYYRATFMAPCDQLPFTEHVGFATDALDTLDKFDSIVVGHQRCYFQTFTEIPKPAGFGH